MAERGSHQNLPVLYRAHLHCQDLGTRNARLRRLDAASCRPHFGRRRLDVTSGFRPVGKVSLKQVQCPDVTKGAVDEVTSPEGMPRSDIVALASTTYQSSPAGAIVRQAAANGRAAVAEMGWFADRQLTRSQGGFADIANEAKAQPHGLRHIRQHLGPSQSYGISTSLPVVARLSIA